MSALLVTRVTSGSRRIEGDGFAVPCEEREERNDGHVAGLVEAKLINAGQNPAAALNELARIAWRDALSILDFYAGTRSGAVENEIDFVLGLRAMIKGEAAKSANEVICCNRFDQFSTDGGRGEARERRRPGISLSRGPARENVPGEWIHRIQLLRAPERGSWPLRTVCSVENVPEEQPLSVLDVHARPVLGANFGLAGHGIPGELSTEMPVRYPRHDFAKGSISMPRTAHLAGNGMLIEEVDALGHAPMRLLIGHGMWIASGEEVAIEKWAHLVAPEYYGFSGLIRGVRVEDVERWERRAKGGCVRDHKVPEGKRHHHPVQLGYRALATPAWSGLAAAREIERMRPRRDHGRIVESPFAIECANHRAPVPESGDLVKKQVETVAGCHAPRPRDVTGERIAELGDCCQAGALDIRIEDASRRDVLPFEELGDDTFEQRALADLSWAAQGIDRVDIEGEWNRMFEADVSSSEPSQVGVLSDCGAVGPPRIVADEGWRERWHEDGGW